MNCFITAHKPPINSKKTKSVVIHMKLCFYLKGRKKDRRKNQNNTEDTKKPPEKGIPAALSERRVWKQERK